MNLLGGGEKIHVGRLLPFKAGDSNRHGRASHFDERDKGKQVHQERGMMGRRAGKVFHYLIYHWKIDCNFSSVVVARSHEVTMGYFSIMRRFD